MTEEKPQLFYANTVPPAPEKEIVRDSVTSTIVRYFESGKSIVFLEGEEGLGKTTLLRQVYIQLFPNSFGIFINSVSRWANNPETIAIDLLNQYSLALDSQELPDLDESQKPPLLKYQLRLQKEIRKRNRSFIYIVDGLTLAGGPDARLSILNLLPIGIANFRFLFSGSKADFPELEKFSSKELPLPPFGLEETRRFFSDIAMPTGAVEQVHKICNMNPSRLTTVRMLLLEGGDPAERLDSLPETLPTIFELDWNKIIKLTERQSEILALITYTESAPTIELISLILKCSKESVVEVVEKIHFISVIDQTSYITYISEGHRKFAQKKLAHLKETMTKATIDYMLETPKSQMSLLNLPKYFENVGDDKALFDFLTPEHLEGMVVSSHSWKTAKSHASLAFDRAKKLGLNAEMFKYSIEEASLAEFDDAQSWRGMVDAYVALGGFDTAIQLAERAVSIEDRLHLLCVIGRAQRRNGASVNEDLRQEIIRLAKAIDASAVGERAMDIAADLIFIDQDTAIEFVKLSLNNAPISKDAYESLARLTVGAFDSDNEDGKSKDALKKLVEKLNDPAVKGFSSTVSLVFGNSNAESVIASLKEEGSVYREIPILRLWCQENAKRPDALVVVKEAFERAIKATAYTPTALDFRELSYPLRFAADSDDLRELISSFSGQGEVLKRIGPTEEYVRFETSLAMAQVKYDSVGAANRLLETLIFASRIQDVAVRASCIAQIYSAVWQLELLPAIEREAMLQETRAALESNLEEILKTTARQLQVTKGVLRALGRCDFIWALNVAETLNTRDRRERGVCLVLSAKASLSFSESELLFLFPRIDAMLNNEHYTEALLIAIVWLVENDKDGVLSRRFKDDVLKRLKRVENIEERLRGNCLVLAKMSGIPEKFGLEERESLISTILNDWKEIDTSWSKIRLGYNIVVSFAEHSRVLATETLKKVEEFRRTPVIECGVAAQVFVSCIRLAIANFRGIIKHELKNDLRYPVIVRLIERVTSTGIQAKLFSDLALTFHLVGHLKERDEVVVQHVRPRLEVLSKNDTEFYYEIFGWCAPALYIVSNLQGMDVVRRLPTIPRAVALGRILRFLMTRCLGGEPFVPPDDSDHKLNYEEIRQVLHVTEEVFSEGVLYSIIEDIVCTLLSDKARYNVSDQQKSFVASELRRSITRVFPDSSGVAHEGFKIICEAQVSRLVRTEKSEWETFIRRGNSIPNLADSVFVLIVLAQLVPNSHSTNKLSLFRDALAKAKQIPAQIDKLMRLEMLAERSCSVDRAIAKECLEEALNVTHTMQDGAATSFQRQMVDIAYKIDAEFAHKLAAVADEDLSKQTFKKELAERIEENEKRKEMAHGRVFAPKSEKELEAFLENVNKLHGQLNAGKLPALPFESLIETLQIASKRAICEALPILFWITKNLVKKYEFSSHAQKFLNPVFESAVVAADLAARVSLNDSGFVRATGESTCSQDSEGASIIGPGEREKLRKIFRKWVEEQANEFIWIMDPYFGAEELAWVLEIRNENTLISIDIVTGSKHNIDTCKSEDFQSVYREAWKNDASSIDAGETTIHIVGCRGSHEVPFHDRYCISKNSGLRLGTSLGSLGLSKTSEVSWIDPGQLPQIHDEIARYISRNEKSYRSKRVDYVVFSL